ncbi:MAG: glycosyltransferase family 39 protein [Bacteroidia bacterium]|nr:glycosyltransferase family 39 protein [Bacteroidia bacterium]
MLSLLGKINIKWTIAVTIVAVTWVNLNLERWKSRDVIIQDVVHYNSYLPAFFYEHDLTLSFLSDTINKHIESKLYAPKFTPDNKPVIKMSMGMSVTYLPFFTLAHIYSKLFNYPADGFSEPYHIAILFSSLFYYVIGLIFLWKILRMHFSERLSCLSLFCLTFGTNVLYYLTVTAGMTHIVDFTLIAAFTFYTIKWQENPSLKYAFFIGLIGGLLTLIRPINILIFIFFLLFGVNSGKDFRVKIKLYFSKKFHLATIVIIVTVVFSPQMLYWKYITGRFFFNSYVGEHFYFDNPHIAEALFGFRKGWLVYTPIMIFSLTGFFFLRENLKRFLIPLVVFSLVYLYVAFSWWCWWYGGSFGQRALIDIYPLLAITFTALLAKIQEQKVAMRKLAYFLITSLILLNLFQTVQARYNIIHYDSMTPQNYFRVFFTITEKPDHEKYLKHPDYEKALRGEDED